MVMAVVATVMTAVMVVVAMVVMVKVVLAMVAMGCDGRRWVSGMLLVCAGVELGAPPSRCERPLRSCVQSPQVSRTGGR